MEMSQLKIIPIIYCFIMLIGLLSCKMVEVAIQPHIKTHTLHPNEPPLWGSCLHQCSSQSVPLLESRKRSRDGPHQKHSRAIMALSFFNSLGLKMSLLLQLQ